MTLDSTEEETLPTAVVIDDDAEIRYAVVAILNAMGFKTFEAECGEKGLQLIGAHRPDCVVLDHHMPGRSGLGVLKEIRKVFSEMAVIVLTGDSNQNVAIQYFREGADDFVPKPFDIDFLILVIERTMQSRQEREQLFLAQSAHRAEEEANRMKSRFFTSFRHATGNLLHQLNGWLELVEDSCSSEGQDASQGENALKKAMETTNRLGTQLTRLTDFFRWEQGTLSIERKNCSLKELLSRVVTPFMSRINNRRIELVLPEFADDPVLFCDPDHICEAISIALDNAISVTPPGSTITISTLFSEGSVALHLCDQGPGIDESALDTLFMPFPGLTGEGGDAKSDGLGLAMARQIMQRHGGTIELKNIVSDESPRSVVGAVCIFTLPLMIGIPWNRSREQGS